MIELEATFVTSSSFFFFFSPQIILIYWCLSLIAFVFVSVFFFFFFGGGLFVFILRMIFVFDERGIKHTYASNYIMIHYASPYRINQLDIKCFHFAVVFLSSICKSELNPQHQKGKQDDMKSDLYHFHYI